MNGGYSILSSHDRTHVSYGPPDTCSHDPCKPNTSEVIILGYLWRGEIDSACLPVSPPRTRCVRYGYVPPEWSLIYAPPIDTTRFLCRDRIR
eukprot:scaffold191335_cov45-Attheya_sp.AAC.1